MTAKLKAVQKMAWNIDIAYVSNVRLLVIKIQTDNIKKSEFLQIIRTASLFDLQ